MKKTISSILLCTFLITSVHPVMGDELDKLAAETDKLWRPGTGAEDGAFTAQGMSMLGWGLGLATAIAIVVLLVSSSTSNSSHAHCH